MRNCITATPSSFVTPEYSDGWELYAIEAIADILLWGRPLTIRRAQTVSVPFCCGDGSVTHAWAPSCGTGAFCAQAPVTFGIDGCGVAVGTTVGDGMTDGDATVGDGMRLALYDPVMALEGKRVMLVMVLRLPIVVRAG